MNYFTYFSFLVSLASFSIFSSFLSPYLSNAGVVYMGAMPMIAPGRDEAYQKILKWADKYKRMMVRECEKKRKEKRERDRDSE